MFGSYVLQQFHIFTPNRLHILNYRNFLKTIEGDVDFNSSSTKTLDIGCGAGTWLMVTKEEVDQITFYFCLKTICRTWQQNSQQQSL